MGLDAVISGVSISFSSCLLLTHRKDFPVGSLHSGKESACWCRRLKTRVESLGWEDPLEEEMATHSSIPAWGIPRTEEPDRQQSTGLPKAEHDRAAEQTQMCLWLCLWLTYRKRVDFRILSLKSVFLLNSFNNGTVYLKILLGFFKNIYDYVICQCWQNSSILSCLIILSYVFLFLPQCVGWGFGE